jgi:7-cyano-7-deazaguanine synthase
MNMKKEKKIAVMSASGGMDSTGVLLNFLRRGFKVFCLSFDYGQKHAIELTKLKRNLFELQKRGHDVEHMQIDIAGFGSLLGGSLTDDRKGVPRGHYESEQMKQTVVPNRNMIFSSFVYSLALSKANEYGVKTFVGLGVHSGDHAIYPDCRKSFFKKLKSTCQHGNWNGDSVEWFLPYIDETKVEILTDIRVSCANLDLNPEQILKNTWTSYAPDDYSRADGFTGSDVERILAFIDLGLVDPIEYSKPWEVVKQNAIDQRK